MHKLKNVKEETKNFIAAYAHTKTILLQGWYHTCYLTFNIKNLQPANVHLWISYESWYKHQFLLYTLQWIQFSWLWGRKWEYRPAVITMSSILYYDHRTKREIREQDINKLHFYTCYIAVISHRFKNSMKHVQVCNNEPSNVVTG
jgi:hypothetical protein